MQLAKDSLEVIRVADYVVQKLVKFGVKHAFIVTGGGAMHLNDAFGRNKDIECIFNHHEQACSIAADGYYRASNKMPVVGVTSGPGGTNAVTGVYGAWTDSIPMFVISGQVKYETYSGKYNSGLRQLGDQEVNIVSLVQSITKYSSVIANSRDVRFHTEKAFYYANEGRPGPVWLDIPLDVQGALVDESELEGFAPESLDEDLADLDSKIDNLIVKLEKSSCPVLMIGTGVALSQTKNEILELVGRLKIPVVTAWNAHYLVEDDNEYYVGRPGTVGDRAGNIAVQNSDLLIVLGSRLNIRQISYDWNSFAEKAYKVMVDIDEKELNKPTLNVDLKINFDLRDFVSVIKKKSISKNGLWGRWLEWCLERRARYPVVDESYRKDRTINPYVFMRELSRKLDDGSVTVCANGSACVMAFQSFVIKKDQKLFTNSGCAAMGYDLPAAIGACLSRDRKSTVCLAGDGSIMMNLQELQTIVTYDLPIKVFVINNNGYHSISQTQNSYFPGSLMGFSPETGVSFPDFKKIAMGFGVKSYEISSLEAFDCDIDDILSYPGPVLCEVIVNEKQLFSPKLSSKKMDDGTIVSSRLENMYPFLTDDEMVDNYYPNHVT